MRRTRENSTIYAIWSSHNGAFTNCDWSRVMFWTRFGSSLYRDFLRNWHDWEFKKLGFQCICILCTLKFTFRVTYCEMYLKNGLSRVLVSPFSERVRKRWYEREGIGASVSLLARRSTLAFNLIRAQCELAAPDYFERETDCKQSRVLDSKLR